MEELNPHFEFIDKEDVIKKIVSQAFGRFLAYYADAPEIDVLPEKKGRSERSSERGGNSRGRTGGNRKAEKGYKRLFINLGKADGFYPGEVMQYVNKHVQGRQDIGHIDLLSKFSYIEVPERDAQKVMKALDGTWYKGREVRCNDAETPRGERTSAERGERKGRSQRERGVRGESFDRSGKGYSERQTKEKGKEKGKGKRGQRGEVRMESGRQDDWRQFFQGHDIQLIGEEPDFAEEGWARRKPKKK